MSREAAKRSAPTTSREAAKRDVPPMSRGAATRSGPTTRRLADAARRAIDVAVAGTLLVAAAPLLAVLGLLVRATSPGPALFVQERVGKDGGVFGLLKLRTMVADAPARGGALTTPGDPRVTRVGAWLRRWKLDELPQLANVVRGDMSLVGPRPEVPRYVAGYSARQRAVLRVRPGITDPASLAYADEAAVLGRFDDCERAYVETVLPAKLALSLDYLERRTLRSDLGVLLRTLIRVARGGRAYPDTMNAVTHADESPRRAALG
jgi:lipopolysaccharide/colanic/teichoic acid biosynthesis glycosyltransferase